MTDRPELHHLLVSTRVRRLEGAEPPHRDPTLTSVRRGYFRVADAPLTVSERYRLRILATADARRDGLVFTHASAAELWDCPQLATDLRFVHVTVPGSARRTTAGVKVHRGAIPQEHVVELASGLRVSSREWTAIQVAASQPFPNALLALDRLVAGLVEASARPAHDVIESLVGLIPPRMKGGARAASHLRLADPRSGSAGESLSRGQMVRLGLPRPELQVRFARDDDPGDDIVDFDWPELGVFGEFDGRAKYVDPELTQGRTPHEVLWDEKLRENRIRRHRPRGARWGWEDALSPARLARVLAAAGVQPMPRVSP